MIGNLKRFGIASLATLLIFTSFKTSFASGLNTATNEIKLFLNGNKIDSKVMVINGSSYLPLKAIGEALGLRVNWDNTTRSVLLESAATDSTDKEMLELMTKNNEALKSENDELKKLLLKNGIKIPTVSATKKYLDELTPVASENAYATYDTHSIEDNGGNTYKHYLSLSDKMWESASITYAPKGQFDVFKCTATLTNSAFEYSDVDNGTVYIYADDELIKKVEVAKGKLAQDVEVSIKGAKLVRVEYFVTKHWTASTSETVILGDARFE